MEKWLTQPYPFSAEPNAVWRESLFGGLFVLFFLFIFQPFGLSYPSGHSLEWLQVCAEYGSVTFVVSMIWGSVIRRLPQVFSEATWTVWKEIVSTLVFVSLIATANLLYTAWRYDMSLTWGRFWAWQLLTWGVGIFPTAIGIFLKQMRLLRRYTAGAAVLSQQIEDQHKDPPAPVVAQPVMLSGDNQGEQLLLLPDQIRYLSAADNYVQVYFLENGVLKNRILRSTMKKMEDVLVAYPNFFRCHRTYLVNLDQVRHVSGNAQGYRLHLEGVEEPVPVSRNLNEVILERFNPK